MTIDETIISQTKKWINEVVVGCNFCPFAAKVIKRQAVFYAVEHSADFGACLQRLLQEAERLDNDNNIETSFLLLPNGFDFFDDFLDLVAGAEKMLHDHDYEGIYQLASFHPDYLFAGAVPTDAANYTNKSIYPMLHLLREASIDTALEHYKNPEAIPGRNIDFAREKGLVYMKLLRDACKD